MKIMKEKLKLKISKMMSSIQPCRPTDVAASAVVPLGRNPNPRNIKRPDNGLGFPFMPPRAPRPSSIVAGCGLMLAPPGPRVSADVDLDDMSRARETPACLWRKEEKWGHACSYEEEFERRRKKIEYDEDEDDDLFPSSGVRKMEARSKTEVAKPQHRRRRQKSSRPKSLKGTSSIASGSSWFSSDDDQENDEKEDGDDTDLSFSTNSSVSSAMLSKLFVTYKGKVKESIAVEKKSEDPRGDFRRSMVEMVLEKGIYEAVELEQLLHCFLSLNSRQHHRAIVSAFADIWEAIFPKNSSDPGSYK